MTSFHAEVAAEELEHRKGLEDVLRRIHDLREAKRQIEKSLEEVELPVREHLRLNPDDVLMDDHGYTARLQRRSGGTAYASTLEIQAKAPALFDKLATLGLLQVDPKRVRDAQQRGEITADELKSWRHELGGSAALIVEKKE